MRRAVAAGVAGLLAVAAACAGDPGVRTEEASAITVESTPPPPDAPDTTWMACPGITTVDVIGEWECAWIAVPMDRRDADTTTVEVALTRPVLDDGDERRPLVLEPGGPGDSGVAFAWTFAEVLPLDLLDEFYPVGWDPRGVGSSRPAIDCGPIGKLGPTPSACVEGTGDLLGFVGAADAALDLEEVRIALGVERLDYLGYSYGTALGAVYAMAHPDGVGHFVLDGAIDPMAGDQSGASRFSDIWYAGDDRDLVLERFRQLCDATPLCVAGPDSVAAMADVERTVVDLPTEDFAGDPETLSSADYEAVLDTVLFDPWSWGLIGDALADARGGDASALAGLADFQAEGYGGVDSDRYVAASFAIYCADFSDVSDEAGCAGMPPAADLPVITDVEVETPILVIGTEYDPATPGRHAADLAVALGDATTMTWEGVGHTAYPISACVDAAVLDYLGDGMSPAPGLRCPFVDGMATDADIADVLFDYPRPWIGDWIESELLFDGETDERAACLGRALGRAEHRVQTHVIREVTSDAATAAVEAAGC